LSFEYIANMNFSKQFQFFSICRWWICFCCQALESSSQTVVRWGFKHISVRFVGGWTKPRRRVPLSWNWWWPVKKMVKNYNTAEHICQPFKSIFQQLIQHSILQTEYNWKIIELIIFLKLLHEPTLRKYFQMFLSNQEELFLQLNFKHLQQKQKCVW
jgi:hypothetical protein